MVKEKGTDELANLLCSEIFDQNPDLCLKIVGSGSEQESLRSIVSSRKLANQVEFIGHQNEEEMKLHYQWADLVLFTPAWQEPFGMVGLEAISAGASVIIRNNSGPKEWAKDFQNNVIITNNLEEVKNCIRLFRRQDQAIYEHHDLLSQQLSQLEQYISKF